MRRIPLIRSFVVVLVFAALSVSAAEALGPDDGRAAKAAAGDVVTREELTAVAAEVARLRDEIAMLRRDLDVARAGRDEARALTTGAAAGQPPAAPPVELLQAQVEELSQTKVESASRMPVRLFGAIVSNTVINSGVANWLENPNLVDAGEPAVEPGSFTSTLRQSQIGLNVGPMPVGRFTASGAMVADFFGGTPGFVTGTVFGLPRIVYAFARLEHAGTAIVVGQDHNLLAPRDPTSLAAQAFPLLFRSGNLYLRSPQVRVEQRAAGFTFKGGIAAPVAADASGIYVFAPTAGAGERSRRPAIEGRVDYTLGSPDRSAEVTVAASARRGWRKPTDTLRETTSYAADFNARVGRVGAAGEFFDTDDAAEFGAAVAQPRAARGGWVEGRLRLTTKLSANGGFGMDEVRERVAAATRQENRSAFGNVIFDLTPEVALSMEYRWLETRLGQALAKRTNRHVNATFVVRF